MGKGDEPEHSVQKRKKGLRNPFFLKTLNIEFMVKWKCPGIDEMVIK